MGLPQLHRAYATKISRPSSLQKHFRASRDGNNWVLWLPAVMVVIGPVFAVLKMLIDFPVIVPEFPAAVGHTFDIIKTL